LTDLEVDNSLGRVIATLVNNSSRGRLAATERKGRVPKEKEKKSPEEVAKRRPVISAKERGHPGRYALPPTVGYVDHDVTEPGGSAYSFRTRMSSTMISVDSSPGPRYHVGANVTRFGRAAMPSYTMLGRGKRIGSKGDKFQTPGPGTYKPQHANATQAGPGFTDGKRSFVKHICLNVNSYTLPKLLGNQVPDKASGVSYSMSARRPSVDLAQSPGPCGYNSTRPDVYLRRQPSLSMRSRTERPTYPSATPGPGAYRPERSGAHLRRAPSFTMGVRHSEFVTPLVLDFAR
ncbi:outer dense fiber protein 3-like protein 2a, partial [Phycodurus eques]|uniref:outer dense fiber protein 3-like protein 2a n=1 Tax=Phycodurus eques TaxID=693459 RepID=UPI002ACE668A